MNEKYITEVSQKARDYLAKLFPNGAPQLAKTDPEFAAFFENFASDEVVNSDDLDDRTRLMAVLAALLGCQGLDAYKGMLTAALNRGVTPVEVKEVVYQAAAYIGIGRMLPFLNVTNEILKARGVRLPLEGQSTTTPETRLAAGAQAQIDIFGPGMKDFYKSGPEESRHINRWLAENCFGDYYTRGGLDYKQREMVTFCCIAAQGGCEPQLTAHAAANLRLGNDKSFLIKIVSQCLPYIGYPHSLNALSCVNEAAAKLK